MKAKRYLFGFLAACIPFVILLALEGALRFGGVGDEGRAAFVPVPEQEAYRAANPRYGARYFRGFVPAVAFNPFVAAPTDETFRVVVLGGSSTAGFPYPFYDAFPARLADRLREAAPLQHVEVVNLGMTAVNSFTLWDLRKAVAELSPDAVVVYAGHNEYYGAFGAGSSVYALGGHVGLKRLVLRLKHLALYNALEQLLAPAPEASPTRTLMARVVQDATITRGGPVYEAGIEQYAANLSEVVETMREAGVPVYLGTLASNLKDQPPLGQDPAAQAAYAEGQQLLAAGDTLAARTAFLEAKEADDIRFRAPEAMNEVVRELAEQPGVELVDVQAMLRRHSPGQIEGATLFDDHLHPNARGYDLMAEAFFDALQAHPALDAAAPPPPGMRPVDPVGDAYARLQVARLTGGYPFEKGVTPEEEGRRYRALLEDAFAGGYADSLAAAILTQQTGSAQALQTGVRRARALGDTLDALLLYRALLHWQPFNEPLAERALGFALSTQQHDAVTGELARLVTNEPDPSLDALNALAAVRLRQGRLDEARALLQRVEARDADSEVMLFNTARLLVLQGDTLSARRYFERYRRGE